MKDKPTDGRKIIKELFGLFLIFWGLLVLLSLISFDQNDPSINHMVSNAKLVRNQAGIFGAYLSGLLVDIFGFAALVWPVVFIAWGAGYISTWFKMPWWRWLGFIILGTCFISFGSAWNLGLGDVRGGGMLGQAVYSSGTAWFSPTGSILIWLFLFFVSLELAFSIAWLTIFKYVLGYLSKKAAEHNWTWARVLGLFPLPDLSKLKAPKPEGAPLEIIALYELHDAPEDKLGRLPEYKTKSELDLHWQPVIELDTPVLEQDAGGVRVAAVRVDNGEVDATETGEAQLDSMGVDSAKVKNIRVDAVGAVNAAGEVDVAGEVDAAGEVEEKPLLSDTQKNIQANNQADAQQTTQKVAQEAVKDPALPFQAVTAAVSSVMAEQVQTAILNGLAEAQATVAKSIAPKALNPVISKLADSRSEAAKFEAAPAETFRVEESKPEVAKFEAAKPEAAKSEAYNLEAPKPEAFRVAKPEVLQPEISAAVILKPEPFQPEVPREVPRPEIPQPDAPPVAIAKPAKPVKRKLPLPPLDILQPAQQSDSLPTPEVLEDLSLRLMNCFEEFNSRGDLVRVTPGPVITLFEIRPAPGVRVGRFTNLTDDLARSLKAMAIRMQAPVPGCDTVGIEIPNEKRATVNFKELMESAAFNDSASLLTMAIGKDIAGRPAVRDLAAMPHVLVAGTTGAGKSVCLNSILVSFLYKASPDELKLMLVDPKRVEMAMYADLPHLVHPVVTETSLAKTALEWAVQEMDSRYTKLARFGVKNIKDFNKKFQAMSEMPPEFSDLSYMPYLVIVIDELADLMLTAGKDVESCLVRLAQLARAAGIHLIVATQRPSVDVVTGLIKANFPCRIAFQVANKYDSRTILDAAGAEQLLGKGDMLFKPSGGKLERLHGPFVTDEEVQAVVDHWKRQQAPHYEVDFTSFGQDTSRGSSFSPSGSSGNGSDEDALYAEAVTFVQEQGKMSISLLQRRFRIGFNKAARFVERMEQDGILPPADRANKSRQVRSDP